MDPLSLAIGGIGSLLSGLFGLGSQTSSNASMLRATRETNAQNYKIWQEAKSHNVNMFNMERQSNIDMWNMQNEYNDPSAQVERLQAAGLNPYLAMSSGNASGIAISSPSSASVNPTSTPEMQAPPPEAFRSGMSEALDRAVQTFSLFSQFDLNDANAGTLRGMLPYNQAHTAADTANINQDTKFKQKLTKGQKLQNQFDEATLQNRIILQEQIMNGQMIQNSYDMLKVEAQEVINEYLEPQQLVAFGSAYVNMLHGYWQGKITEKEFEAFDKKLSATIRNLDSGTYGNYASAERDYAEIPKIYAETYEVNARIRERDASARLSNAKAYGHELENGALAKSWNEYCDNLKWQFLSGISAGIYNKGQYDLGHEQENLGRGGFSGILHRAGGIIKDFSPLSGFRPYPDRNYNYR